MNPTIVLPLLVQGLIAGVIVGAVTASIRSWVDRFFLVILLVSMMGLSIHEAIIINLIVVGIAALMMALRQTSVLTQIRADWAMIIIASGLGGMLGRLLGLSLTASILIALLGIYAILVGIHLLFVKPAPARDDPAHPARLAPVAFVGGLMAGLLSAGGKPFTVPVYNWALGHHPNRAYALGSLGVVTAIWAALTTQIAVGQFLTPKDMAIAAYEFIVITLTALLVGALLVAQSEPLGQPHRRPAAHFGGCALPVDGVGGVMNIAPVMQVEIRSGLGWRIVRTTLGESATGAKRQSLVD